MGQTKRLNVNIVRVSERKDRNKGAENLFKDIMAEDFPNLGKVWP